MTDHHPIHFDGAINNASRTPRNEVGGLAVFEGVLMRSRSGFAIAIRRADGAITLRQIPYASLVMRRKGLGFPLLRGTAALAEMMVIGTRALRYSSRMIDRREPRRAKERPAKLTFLLVNSILLMLGLFVVVPNVATSLLMHYSVLADWLGIVRGSYAEADFPVLFNLLSGCFRLLILLGYIVFLGLSPDIRRVFQYHGAEHKAVLALEEGRDVTVGRARVHDTLHPRCGTTLLTIVALITIPMFAVGDGILRLYLSGYPSWPFVVQKFLQVVIHFVLLPVVVGLSFELVKFCSRRPDNRWCRWTLKPGVSLQRLTTRQPDDRQLEVAIIALLGALAIPPGERRIRTYTVRGLEDDETAPGFLPRSPARPAPEPVEAPPIVPSPNHHLP